MVKLAEMARGKVAALVEDALNAVAENIADERTDPEARRRITLQIDVQSDAQRLVALFIAQTKLKLAEPQGVGGVLYAQRQKDGGVVFHEGEMPEGAQPELGLVEKKKG